MKSNTVGPTLFSLLPDIRGMPSPDYQSRMLKTYCASAEAQCKPAAWLVINAVGYAKYKDRCPAFSSVPGTISWDPAAETPMSACGLSMRQDIASGKSLSLQLTEELSRSVRYSSAGTTPYEWNIPWSCKALLRYRTWEDHMNFYLTGYVYAGLPYRDVVSEGGMLAFDSEIRRVPLYKRIDFQWEFSQPVEGNRWVTRYDLYINCINLINMLDGWTWSGQWIGTNTREYYWDSNFERRELELQWATLSLGFRIGFRL